MNKNSSRIASIIQTIGTITIVVGILIMLSMLDNDGNATLSYYIAGAGFVLGMIFIGFGEIIELLSQSVQKQTVILSLLQQERWNGTVGNSQMQEISLDRACNMVVLCVGQNQLLSITTREDASFTSEFDEKVVDVSWEDWQGDSTILSIRGVAPGKTDVYITGQNSGKVLCVQVIVVQ